MHSHALTERNDHFRRDGRFNQDWMNVLVLRRGLDVIDHESRDWTATAPKFEP
jgi:hypothetical protein